MAQLKTIRLKKLESLESINISEGATYYVEENNTFYRDIRSTRMAVGQAYLTTGSIGESANEDQMFELTNSLVVQYQKELNWEGSDEVATLYAYDNLGNKTLVRTYTNSIRFEEALLEYDEVSRSIKFVFD